MNAPVSMPAAEREDLLARMRGLVAALEVGDDACFETRLNELLREREAGLYRHLGRITRDLHRAVSDLKYDGQLTQLARAEMPDAAARLDHVIEISEKAAHRTLDLVEKCRVVTARLADGEVDLAYAHQRLQQFTHAPGPLAVLADDVAQVHDTLKGSSAQLRGYLSELAQAQEYQDLSGQVIRKVITLVHSVEATLISLLQASGSNLTAAAPAAPQGLAGPVIAGINEGASQQDADALLAELGF